MVAVRCQGLCYSMEQVLVAVIGRTAAACDGRPVIVSPADDEKCLSYINQTITVSSTRVYSLRVLARSKDFYTRLNHHFFTCN